MQIYLAGALFSLAEINFNKDLAEAIRKYGYTVFLPQDECNKFAGPQISDNPFLIAEEIHKMRIAGIETSDLILAILENSDVDSGTCFEVGYAYGHGIPILGLRTDFRSRADDGGLNCMISKSCEALCTGSSIQALADVVHEWIVENNLIFI